MARRLRIRGLTALASATMAALLSVSPAGATHHGEGIIDTVSVLITYQAATAVGASDQLAARLQLDDGSPLTAVEVSFWREVDFLGPRRIFVGAATTDASGTARVAIGTAATTLRITADFVGDEHYLPAQATRDIELPPSANQPDGDSAAEQGGSANLAVFATAMPLLLALAAFSVWLLMFGLTARTVLAIRRGRPATSTAKGERS
ncbi:MAG: hypothetical protein WD830_07495 [Chloroflexota bacterium]